MVGEPERVFNTFMWLAKHAPAYTGLELRLDKCLMFYPRPSQLPSEEVLALQRRHPGFKVIRGGCMPMVGSAVGVDLAALQQFVHAKVNDVKPLLLKLIRLNIRWMLVLFDLLCVLRLGALTRFIPITDVRCFPRSLSSAQRREWAVMDTFDAFSPEYDNPQRVQDVGRMFSSRGCEVTHAGLVTYPAGSSMVVRAIKRAA